MTARPPAAPGIARALMVMAVPLALWRLAYPLTDWAALALAPLAVAIWAGIYVPLRDRRRAELAAAILPGAALGRWLTGRAGAGLNATAATLISLPLLAWTALGARAPVLAVLAGVCLLAGGLAVATQRLFAGALTEPYARIAGHRIASALAALAGFAPLVWINWAVVPVPHEITGMDLAQAARAALERMPGRGGWLGEAMGAFAGLDAAKLWLAARYRDAAWVGLVFCVDAALIAFVTARAFVAVQDFARRAAGAMR